MLAAIFACSANTLNAGEFSSASDPQAEMDSPASVANQSQVQLSESQRQTILKEAGELYSKAIAIAKTDSAEANDLFTSSAEKYQLLVDSGIHNSRLYMNLGNAHLQSNQLGLAVANYERARLLDPSDRQLCINLELAHSLVEGQPTQSDTAVNSSFLKTAIYRLRTGNEIMIGSIGLRPVIWTLVVSSLTFWGILITRAAGYCFLAKGWALAPLLVLAISLTSVSLATTQSQNSGIAIIVARNVTLYAGDGEQFPVVASIDVAQGHRVQTLAHRGRWTQVKTAHGDVGWMEDKQLSSL
jgi:tetratricopeptide (TPR) repeat protein